MHPVWSGYSSYKKSVELITHKGISYNNITLYVDNQAAIKALASNQVNSRLVSDCQDALKKIDTKYSIQICWVPVHKGFEENKKADELAKQGSELKEELSERKIYPHMETSKRRHTYIAGNITNTSQETLSSCKKNSIKCAPVTLQSQC